MWFLIRDLTGGVVCKVLAGAMCASLYLLRPVILIIFPEKFSNLGVMQMFKPH